MAASSPCEEVKDYDWSRESEVRWRRKTSSTGMDGGSMDSGSDGLSSKEGASGQIDSEDEADFGDFENAVVVAAAEMDTGEVQSKERQTTLDKFIDLESTMAFAGKVLSELFPSEDEESFVGDTSTNDLPTFPNERR